MLSILAGASDALSRGFIKKVDLHPLTITALGYSFALPYYFCWLFLTGLPVIEKRFWTIIIIRVPLANYAAVLTAKAHLMAPLMKTMPYLCITPALLLLTSLFSFFGGASSNTTEWVGVLILVSGIYVLYTSDKQGDLLQPIRQLKTEPAARYMLAVNLIYALTTNMEFAAMASSNPPFYMLVNHGLFAILSGSMAMFWQFRNWVSKEIMTPKGKMKPLALYGSAIAVAMIATMMAYQAAGSVPYVIAIKRSGSISVTMAAAVFGFLAVFLGEKGKEENKDLKYRIPGAVLMLLGMLISMYGKYTN